MEVGLFQQQTTSLVMTQELRQAIHLLQYSSTDVAAYIEEQALENPLLEVKERKSPLTRLRESHIGRQQGSRLTSDEKHTALENTSAVKESLTDVLVAQLTDITGNKTDTAHLTYLIGSLREDGYLERPLADVCEERGLTIAEGERLLALLQTLDPAGVGARTLGECLLLQLKRKPWRNWLAEQIVMLHMEELALRRWKDLAAKYDVDISEIQLIYDDIQLLDPRPGSRYSNEPTLFVEPDLSISCKEDGSLAVTIFDDVLPAIELNTMYEQILKSSDREASAYAKQKSQQVEWLKRSLAQRQQTISQVAEVLVGYQYEFLASKNGLLKPLTLREVAEEIGVHESTVSRATANKFAQTPRGLIELKSFFSSAISGKAGWASASSQTVKGWLKGLIEAENKAKPLSDQKLMALLEKEKGLSLSRRVIAKYRDELGILSSAKRKRYEERLS
ncbi:RNA polymerase factor sigma-54 [Shouchella shacheensis]|uniref:RNA polymerase factor sigma-54 n=1 Tax=Shouchella shacheensis TaxID=1649580 RepID=UPI00074045FA|nr:RNA polymerase factor sigma-54 [Shouchella shacheensis]